MRWSGRCEGCGEWNSIVEETGRDSAPGGLARGQRKAGRAIELVGLEGSEAPLPRRRSGIVEFDRVCGGGLVPGSAILVGGDPGIGKSTLLLQVAAALTGTRPDTRPDAGAGAGPELACAYFSGEEAVDQIRLRAERLGLAGSRVQLAAATSVRDILATLDSAQSPQVVIIDSIQTMYVDSLESAPGTVSQVRASAQELVRLAKQRGFAPSLRKAVGRKRRYQKDERAF